MGIVVKDPSMDKLQTCTIAHTFLMSSPQIYGCDSLLVNILSDCNDAFHIAAVF